MTEWRAYGLAEIAEAIGQKPEVVRVWYTQIGHQHNTEDVFGSS